MLVRITNREDPDQTASSDLGLPCLSRPFWQATSVRNFRTFTASFFELLVLVSACKSNDLGLISGWNRLEIVLALPQLCPT